jgi:hypothetical protein
MVSYDDTVTSLTDLKQNYAYSDDETDAQDNILREKLRMWHKITRLAFDGTETAVVLPFNTLYEPFYTVDDVDYTTTVIPSPESTETAETTLPSTGNTTTSRGHRIYVNTTCRLKSITRKSGCTAVRATLKTNTGNTILAEANYSGDTATLATPYTLMAGTYYKIESDSSGSTYTYKGRTTGQAYPYNNTYVNYTLGSSNGGNTSVAYNVESIQVYTGEETTEESTTAVYDSTNEYFRFYTDANGCYDTLTSKTISLRYNSRLKSISTTVYAKDTSGNPVNDGFDLQLYNGQEWFNIGNGTEVETIDIDGSDLDADLDADLSRRIINFDTDNTILFQNNIKYRIHYTGTDELIVYKVLIKLNFYKQIELIPGFPTMWGTWGTL